MAKVYLSATYSDLKDYRDAAYRILRKLQHDVIAMEDYVATDAYPPHKCLMDVAACDTYVGLVAWRYGYIPVQDNPERKSITELEYRQAGTSKLPRLMFLADQAVPWPDHFKDAVTGESDNGQRIAIFRAELEQQQLVSYFKTPDHLAGLVSVAVQQALVQQSTQNPPVSTKVQQFKRQVLEKRLASLLENYQTATEQLAYTLNEVDCNKLRRQIVMLEGQLEQISSEIDALR